MPMRVVVLAVAALVAVSGTPSRAAEPVESNAEMARLFNEDQAARSNTASVDWSVVAKADAARREATRKLLNAGSLHAGEDFRRAAFIFQHGSSPEDYLLAHTLAMVAVAKGNSGALWIGTATLDRYLQSIGRAQIYGSQFKSTDGGPVTQEPFDTSVISDALRRELGVPTLAQQADQVKSLRSQPNSQTAPQPQAPTTR